MRPLLPIFVFAICSLLFSSCTNISKVPCFLRYLPSVSIIGFDTTEIDSATCYYFDANYGFDSLLYTKRLRIYDLEAVPPDYSMGISYLLLFGAWDNGSIKRLFNYRIQFGNNRSFELSNIQYEYHCCDWYTSHERKPACYCELSSFKVKTYNCNSTIRDFGFSILP